MSNNRFDMDTRGFKPLGLNLLYISSAKYGGDWHSTLHSHKCTEIFFVISGQGEFLVEDLRFPVKAEDMVIINRNIEHTETGIDRSPMEYIVVGLDGGDFLFKSEEDTRFCVFECGKDGKQIQSIIRNMLNELEHQGEYYGQAAQSWLGLLTIELMRHRELQVDVQPALQASPKCAMVKRYIDNHYTENVTLDTLADYVHLNKYYLGHIFTQEMGISPINYLIQRRIEDGRHFLLNTDYNVVQISQILGFSSASYFSQCFKRQEKISPREFRRRAQEAT